MANDTLPGRRKAAQQIGTIAGVIVDPVIARRAGLTSALIAAWPDIAGPRNAGATRPERVMWPRRSEDGGEGEPATLVVACESGAALRLSHETGELLARVNVFLGYPAVGRIRIVQKPVASAVPRRRAPPALDAEEEARVARLTAGVEDEALKASLAALGRSVRADRKARQGRTGR